MITEETREVVAGTHGNAVKVLLADTLGLRLALLERVFVLELGSHGRHLDVLGECCGLCREDKLQESRVDKMRCVCWERVGNLRQCKPVVALCLVTLVAGGAAWSVKRVENGQRLSSN